MWHYTFIIYSKYLFVNTSKIIQSTSYLLSRNVIYLPGRWVMWLGTRSSITAGQVNRVIFIPMYCEDGPNTDIRSSVDYHLIFPYGPWLKQEGLKPSEDLRYTILGRYLCWYNIILNSMRYGSTGNLRKESGRDPFVRISFMCNYNKNHVYQKLDVYLLSQVWIRPNHWSVTGLMEDWTPATRTLFRLYTPRLGMVIWSAWDTWISVWTGDTFSHSV